jgi:hypothetical protein
MRAFLFQTEFYQLVPIDRLHHAHPGEHDRTIILRGLGDGMRGGLHLFHSMFGFRNLFCQPRDRILERDELPAIGWRDRGSTRLFQRQFISKVPEARRRGGLAASRFWAHIAGMSESSGHRSCKCGAVYDRSENPQRSTAIPLLLPSHLYSQMRVNWRV